MVKLELNTDDVMTVPEAARLLGRPKITLYRWIETGKVNCIQLNGVRLITRVEVERLKKEKGK